MGKAPRLGDGRNGDGRASFVAHIQKIRMLIEAGYTARTVYEQHADELKISYRQFLRYIHQYIKDDSSSGPQPGNRVHQNEKVPRQTKPSEPPARPKPPFEMLHLDPEDL